MSPAVGPRTSPPSPVMVRTSPARRSPTSPHPISVATMLHRDKSNPIQSSARSRATEKDWMVAAKRLWRRPWPRLCATSDVSGPSKYRFARSQGGKMFVRLKIEDTREGLVATISQGDDGGKIAGRPSIFLVGGKEEAKQRAKAVARALGLKTYRVLDRTGSRMSPPIHPA